MIDLDFNAGRLGMSKERLMSVNYQNLLSSARTYGYTVSRTKDKTTVFGPDRSVLGVYDDSDILRGRTI